MSKEDIIASKKRGAFKGSDSADEKFIPTCKICGEKHWPAHRLIPCLNVKKAQEKTWGQKNARAEAKAKLKAEKKAKAEAKARAKVEAKSRAKAEEEKKAEERTRASEKIKERD